MTRCTASLAADLPGNVKVVRCERDAGHPLSAPPYIDSQTPTDGAHRGEGWSWWVPALGASYGPATDRAVYSPVEGDQPQPFHLVRDVDHTGVSGTGVVAEGVQFTDGRLALRWVSARARPSTACWDSLDDMLQVHGHDGATRVEWL